MSKECELCSVRCSSAALFADHLSGKRHAHALDMSRQRVNLIACSVFLSSKLNDKDCNKMNYDEQGANREEIIKALSEYGEVECIFPERYLDETNRSHYVIVQFRRAEDAQNLLKNVKRLKIGNGFMNVHERKLDFYTAKVKEHGKFSFEDVLNVLKEMPHYEYTQIDKLISEFSLGSKEVEERICFVQKLASFIQQFFVQNVEVRIFGSTNSGLAFYNSDLDLNFVINKDEFCSNGMEDMDDLTDLPSASHEISGVPMEDNCDFTSQPSPSHEIFGIRRLSRTEFLALSGYERAQFLTKLINRFRKERANITTIVCARDARYPVIRFDWRLKKKDDKMKKFRLNYVSCELSVQNLFSERKANVIHDVCNADISGNFQKFLFLVKLWAQCNNLFAFVAEKRMQKKSAKNSNWKSYAFSLLAVSFFQSRGDFSPFSMRENSEHFDGWLVDYDLPRFDLSNAKFSKLLHDFFVFLYNSIGKPSIYSIRNGKIYSIEEFKLAFPKIEFLESNITSSDEKIDVKRRFRISLVNLQDPLELSHNVTANVSREAVTSLRRALMFSIAALKQEPSGGDFVSAIFRIDELKMKFLASTNENTAQNAMQRDSGNIFTIPLGDKRLNANFVFDTFAALLQHILLIDLVDEPLAKKSCRYIQADNLDLETFEKECSDLEKKRIFGAMQVLEFAPRFTSWLGRRQLRRKFSNELSTKNLSPLQLEREVSKYLQENTSNLSRNSPELFRFHVQLYLSEAKEMQLFDVTKTKFNEQLNEAGELSSIELCAIFSPPENVPERCQSFQDLASFLSTFLTKYLRTFVYEKAGFEMLMFFWYLISLVKT